MTCTICIIGMRDNISRSYLLKTLLIFKERVLKYDHNKKISVKHRSFMLYFI